MTFSQFLVNFVTLRSQKVRPVSPLSLAFYFCHFLIFRSLFYFYVYLLKCGLPIHILFDI